MVSLKRYSGQLLLLLLSCIGLAISIYLTVVHYNTSVQLYCSSTGLVNCERVTSSSFSYVPGTALPITIPGMLLFIGVGLLSFLSWRVWPEQRIVPMVLLAVTGVAVLFVFYLVYAEIVVLHAICAWCTALHVIIFLGFLISVVLFSKSGVHEDEEDEEVVEEDLPSSAISGHS